MPKSKSFLPDVNVWLALASERHLHCAVATKWLNSVDSSEVFFCRITQMGLLRLLTHSSAMGHDVLSSRDAWNVYRTMLADDRIQFAPEPFALEQEWKRLMSQDRPTPKIWTDAYLVAFAQVARIQLVTLDRAVLALDAEALLLR